MFDTVELFSGVIRFDPLTLAINLLLMVHFVYDWYKMYKATGMKLDYWTLTTSLTYFLPFLIIYPFSSSFFNVISVGDNIWLIQKAIGTAYYIFLLGYASMYFGRYIFDRYSYKTYINALLIKPIRGTLTKLFLATVKSVYTTTILFLIYFLALMAILAYARSIGAVDVRGIFQANPAIRALYNFVLILSSLVSLLLIGRIFQYNKLVDKVLLFFFFIITIFIGARAYTAQPIIYLFVFYVLFELKGRINLLKVFGLGFTLLFFGIALSALREGNFSPTSIAVTFVSQVFYGNSYSDLRDFAWVYAYWDKSLLFGKTYLAGFMSFVPSFLSDFRTEWAIGKFTATTVGFDPMEHPGLRPGLFGESYFNFGLIGVALFGTFLGYAYRYIDFSIKNAAFDDNKLAGIASIVSTMFIFNLAITAGFFSLYVFLIVLILGSAFTKALKVLSK
jgi:oligosaccharide repeat unit polymerase